MKFVKKMTIIDNGVWPWDDLKIGTKFICGDIELEVMEDKLGSCSGCYFNINMDRCSQFKCAFHERMDNTDVVFADVRLKERILSV